MNLHAAFVRYLPRLYGLDCRIADLLGNFRLFCCWTWLLGKTGVTGCSFFPCYLVYLHARYVIVIIEIVLKMIDAQGPFIIYG